MEEKKNNASSFGGSNHQADNQLFRKSALLLSLMVLAGSISQNVFRLVGQQFQVTGLDWLAGLVVYLAITALFSKPLFKLVDQPPFNVTNLAAIALATALGTFVPQHIGLPATGTVGKLINLLQLNDLFHSWWYVAFFVLLAAGLVKISSRKNWSLDNLGFHLAHLSPILILCGFWVDYFLGFRGIIKLEEGQQSNTVLLSKGHSGFLHDSTELGFHLRLDHFEFEKYQPDYRIQLWKQDTAGHAVAVSSHGSASKASPPEILASFPLEPGKIHRIFGTQMHFRLSKFYPDFEFDYEYPLRADTIEAKDPGLMVDLKTPEGDAFVQLQANKAGRNKLGDVVHLGAALEFYWEMPDEVRNTLNKKPFGKENRIIFEGKTEKIHFLLNGDHVVKPLKTNEFHAMSDNDSIGFSVRFLMPDIGYMKAVPSTKSEKLKNPVAKVEVWKKGGPAQAVYLYPNSSGRKGGTFMVPGTSHFLAMESTKDKETKFYKSDLSVLDKNGQVLKERSVRVNEPMQFGGYRFYQTDYDPNNPSYSGIGVSHEPGLIVIYLGFFLLVAGVTHMFYFRGRQGL
ncbi:MAG: cytochrome c biogenesis protein ResB [Saprospiraceae bacterium]